jgi:hypothetical protein
MPGYPLQAPSIAARSVHGTMNEQNEWHIETKPDDTTYDGMKKTDALYLHACTRTCWACHNWVGVAREACLETVADIHQGASLAAGHMERAVDRAYPCLQEAYPDGNLHKGVVGSPWGGDTHLVVDTQYVEQQGRQQRQGPPWGQEHQPPHPLPHPPHPQLFFAACRVEVLRENQAKPTRGRNNRHKRAM